MEEEALRWRRRRRDGGGGAEIEEEAQRSRRRRWGALSWDNTWRRSRGGRINTFSIFFVSSQ